MIKISKIKDKETVEVLAQDNCTRPGYPYYYIKGEDCLNDCTAVNKPRYYKSKQY
ncbi:hypothetical protein [Paeniclostridium hominis]|uniref:hypothetical protein n=1 Tax=Paeniclostridium hominis TaxID=2764329 RepID=UPI0022E91E1D|nr:hypothetical protein [Paeniclostridium hominis]